MKRHFTWEDFQSRGQKKFRKTTAKKHAGNKKEGNITQTFGGKRGPDRRVTFRSLNKPHAAISKTSETQTSRVVHTLTK